MNIELAKTIAMPEFLFKQGFEPTKIKGNDYWYLSPLRNENTASFHVNIGKNVWFDHGIGQGGDLVSYVCAYLKTQNVGYAVSDALRYIKNIGGYAPQIKPIPVETHREEDSALKLKSDREIKHGGLIEYITGRGIPLNIAKMYLRQLYVHNGNSQKDFYTLGIKNEKKGFELRNPYFKGTLGKKYYTFISGSSDKKSYPEILHIFEGFMDYLSIITQRKGKPLEGDAIILNSLSLMTRSIEMIRGFGYQTAHTWLDNDDPGVKATIAYEEFFKVEGILHKPMNDRYKEHKDVNAHHMFKLGL